MIAINNEIKIFFDALKEAKETARKEKDILKAYNQLVREPINYNLLKEFCKL
jgi:radical SAM superfamily enzyme with C-terminal helix-hairpin-helix motif